MGSSGTKRFFIIGTTTPVPGAGATNETESSEDLKYLSIPACILFAVIIGIIYWKQASIRKYLGRIPRRNAQESEIEQGKTTSQVGGNTQESGDEKENATLIDVYIPNQGDENK